MGLEIYFQSANNSIEKEELDKDIDFGLFN
jgi:hypothetical protein